MHTKSAHLIQTMPVEGVVAEGGYTYTMTAQELIEHLRRLHGIEHDKPLRVIGVGATEALGDELTYMNGSLYVISGDDDKITQRQVSLDTKVSFSQIALESIYGLTRRVKLTKPIRAENSDSDAIEINHGGAFAKLLEVIGDKSSCVVTVRAKTRYIKVRAVCPRIDDGTTRETRRISPAADIHTSILGGMYTQPDGTTVKLTPQTIRKQTFDEPQQIKMVGVVTGKDMGENIILQGLHLHCELGHILDLGDLEDVNIEITPISKTFILTPGFELQGRTYPSVWRPAVTADLLPSIKYLQKLFKRAYEQRHSATESKAAFDIPSR